jgi:hypothetical protein
MKRPRCISLVIGITLLFAVQANAAEFLLKGVEVAKGVDVGVLRYGTSFVGEAFDETLGTSVGYWNIMLNYKGAANVGVGGGKMTLLSSS